MISVSKSERSLQEDILPTPSPPSPGPTIFPTPGEIASDVPTLAPAFIGIVPTTSLSPTDTNNSMTPSLAPSMMNNSVPRPLSRLPSVAPVRWPTDTPSEAPKAIHDKEPADQPKTNDGSSSNSDVSNNNDGISNGAIFGMVIAIGAIFVIGYFVFFGGRNTNKRSTRRDGMQEMEMSTWVNKDDNDGLL